MLGRRLTTEEFIEKAKTVHGNEYDYSRVVYEASSKHVILTCNKCNSTFHQTPNGHLAGHGCAACSKELHKSGVTTEDFIYKAKSVHGEWYTYGDVVYVRAKTAVEVTCRIHGNFTILPTHLLSGRNCTYCSRREKFNSVEKTVVTKFKEVHGSRYDYSKVVYLGTGTKVEIMCTDHGSFFCTPSNHKRGRGCPKCKSSGYNTGKRGCFYIFQSSGYVKVGITNRTAKIRLKDINKSSGLNFKEVLVLGFEDGSIPKEIETLILSELRMFYKSPAERFSGSTECFGGVDIVKLISRVTEIALTITHGKCE